MRTLFLAAFVLSLSACANDGPPMPVIPRQLAGSFGGNHVALQLTARGGTLDFDCATGTIGPITPRGSHNYTAIGTYLPAPGGPSDSGLPPVPREVVFNGLVNVDSLSMTGKLSDGSVIGPFILIRDAPPTIYRCM